MSDASTGVVPSSLPIPSAPPPGFLGQKTLIDTRPHTAPVLSGGGDDKDTSTPEVVEEPSFTLSRFIASETDMNLDLNLDCYYDFKSDEVLKARDRLLQLDAADRPEQFWSVPSFGRGSDQTGQLLLAGANWSSNGEQRINRKEFGVHPFGIGQSVCVVCCGGWLEYYNNKQMSWCIFHGVIASDVLIPLPEMGEMGYQLSFPECFDHKLAAFLAKVIWPQSRVHLRTKILRKIHNQTSKPESLRTSGYGASGIPKIHQLPRGAVFVKGGFCYRLMCHHPIKNGLWACMCTPKGEVIMEQCRVSFIYYESLEPLTPATKILMSKSLVAAAENGKIRDSYMRKLRRAMKVELGEANKTLSCTDIPWVQLKKWTPEYSLTMPIRPSEVELEEHRIPDFLYTQGQKDQIFNEYMFVADEEVIRYRSSSVTSGETDTNEYDSDIRSDISAISRGTTNDFKLPSAPAPRKRPRRSPNKRVKSPLKRASLKIATPPKLKGTPPKSKATPPKSKTTPPKSRTTPPKAKVTPSKQKVTPSKQKVTPSKATPTPPKAQTLTSASVRCTRSLTARQKESEKQENGQDQLEENEGKEEKEEEEKEQEKPGDKEEEQKAEEKAEGNEEKEEEQKAEEKAEDNEEKEEEGKGDENEKKKKDDEEEEEVNKDDEEETEEKQEEAEGGKQEKPQEEEQEETDKTEEPEAIEFDELVQGNDELDANESGLTAQTEVVPQMVGNEGTVSGNILQQILEANQQTLATLKGENKIKEQLLSRNCELNKELKEKQREILALRSKVREVEQLSLGEHKEIKQRLLNNVREEFEEKLESQGELADSKLKALTNEKNQEIKALAAKLKDTQGKLKEKGLKNTELKEEIQSLKYKLSFTKQTLQKCQTELATGVIERPEVQNVGTQTGVTDPISPLETPMDAPDGTVHIKTPSEAALDDEISNLAHEVHVGSGSKLDTPEVLFPESELPLPKSTSTLEKFQRQSSRKLAQPTLAAGGIFIRSGLSKSDVDDGNRMDDYDAVGTGDEPVVIEEMLEDETNNDPSSSSGSTTTQTQKGGRKSKKSMARKTLASFPLAERVVLARQQTLLKAKTTKLAISPVDPQKRANLLRRLELIKNKKQRQATINGTPTSIGSSPQVPKNRIRQNITPDTPTKSARKGIPHKLSPVLEISQAKDPKEKKRKGHQTLEESKVAVKKLKLSPPSPKRSCFSPPTSPRTTVSPSLSRSRSPARRGSQSPAGRGSRSPAGSGSRSPDGRGSRSPAGRGSRSPAGSGSLSPDGRSSRSPATSSGIEPQTAAKRKATKDKQPKANKRRRYIKKAAKTDSKQDVHSDTEKGTRGQTYRIPKLGYAGRPRYSGESNPFPRKRAGQGSVPTLVNFLDKKDRAFLFQSPQIHACALRKPTFAGLISSGLNLEEFTASQLVYKLVAPHLMFSPGWKTLNDALESVSSSRKAIAERGDCSMHTVRSLVTSAYLADALIQSCISVKMHNNRDFSSIALKILESFRNRLSSFFCSKQVQKPSEAVGEKRRRQRIRKEKC